MFDRIDDLRHDVEFKFRFRSLRGIVCRFFAYDRVQELGCSEEEMRRHPIFIDFITSSAMPTPAQHTLHIRLLEVEPQCCILQTNHD